MAGILIPRKQIWTRQPQVVCGPSSIALGAMSLGAASVGECVSKIQTTGAKNIGADIGGVYWKYSSGEYESINVGNCSEYTLITVAWMHCNVSKRAYLDCDPSSGTRRFQLTSNDGSNTCVFIPFDSGGNPHAVTVSIVPIYNSGAGKICTIVARCNASGGDLAITGCGSASATFSDANGLSSATNVLLGQQYRLTTLTSANIYGWTILPRFIADAERSLLLNNPWQIFAPQTRSIFVPAAAGGTTSVSADNAASYSVISAVSADTSANYAVRTYAASDATTAYAVRTTAQADNAASYNVRAQISADATASYNLRTTATADSTASYAVLSASSVVSSSTASYNVIGTVAADSSPAYSVRTSAQADSTPSYYVHAAVFADSVAEYNVLAALQSVQTDNSTAYDIVGRVQADIVSAYAVLGEAAAEVALSAQTIADLSAAIANALMAQLTAATLQTNMTHINGTLITGAGTESNPWGGN